jgi:hypothetical protein
MCILNSRPGWRRIGLDRHGRFNVWFGRGDERHRLRQRRKRVFALMEWAFDLARPLAAQFPHRVRTLWEIEAVGFTNDRVLRNVHSPTNFSR